MAGNSKGNVLITGAARRIGRAIACRMAEMGWNVGVHCLNSERQATELCDELNGFGVHAVVCAADLSNEEEVERLFETSSAAIGPITCLINNASIFEEDTFETVTRDLWDRHMEINLRAPFVLSQKMAAALPNDKVASIINIIDQRVWNPTPYFTSYTLSKMAMWDMTQVLARSLAPRIRVNAIGPGPVLQSIHQSATDFAEEVAAVPLKRDVNPVDISRGVQFILESPTMTGQMIALDSGQHLGWLPANGGPQ